MKIVKINKNLKLVWYPETKEIGIFDEEGVESFLLRDYEEAEAVATKILEWVKEEENNI